MATGNNTSSSDYDNIVRHCLKNGTLWEDPEFPAVQSSVFYHQTPPFAFQWKRPHVRISKNISTVLTYFFKYLFSLNTVVEISSSCISS